MFSKFPILEQTETRYNWQLSFMLRFLKNQKKN